MPLRKSHTALALADLCCALLCAAPLGTMSQGSYFPKHVLGRSRIYLTQKKKAHSSESPSLLSPRLGFVFKSVWQATKLAESVSWLATRSKNAVLSPPLFHPPSPWIFFLLHLATVPCIYNKPLSASFSFGPGTSGSWFLFSESA